MKIPVNKSDIFDNDIYIDSWYYEAAEITLKQGIIVEVALEYEDVISTTGFKSGQAVMTTRLSRIYFKIDNHEFETLKELRRALKLKAFL
jgi:hypothetical protein